MMECSEMLCMFMLLCVDLMMQSIICILWLGVV
uniref:Uncharacterized protein n=1 Tax=Arundo donax TaxID=35708 RepID=A0A0A9F9U5_ARUDO